MDGIWLEEIVLHELDTLLRQGEAVFFGPDFALGEAKNRASILKDEFERRIEVR